MNREPTEMELRVAKSICYERGIDPDQSYTLAGEEARPQYLEWLDEARAAIRAMREPTDGMKVLKVGTADSDINYYWLQRMQNEAYQRMIDAASPPEET